VISNIIRQDNNVTDLLYQQEAIDLINNNLSRVMTVLLILAALLMFISFTLIRNTIRLSVYAKRFLINTMKLVGATPAFIRKPFLINNIFTGIIAGIIADGIMLAMLTYFNREYVEIQPFLTISDMVIIFTMVILLGVSYFNRGHCVCRKQICENAVGSTLLCIKFNKICHKKLRFKQNKSDHLWGCSPFDYYWFPVNDRTIHLSGKWF